jgi:hypothetical protein
MVIEMLCSIVTKALKDKFPTPTFPLTAVLRNLQVFLPDPVYTVLIRIFPAKTVEEVLRGLALVFCEKSLNK